MIVASITGDRTLEGPGVGAVRESSSVLINETVNVHYFIPATNETVLTFSAKTRPRICAEI